MSEESGIRCLGELSWEHAQELFELAHCKMTCQPDESFLIAKTGDVIDEEKSVRWNREEVERRQAAYREEEKRLENIRAKTAKDAYEMILMLMMTEARISREQAEILWHFVYDRYHQDEGLFPALKEYTALAKALMAA